MTSVTVRGLAAHTKEALRVKGAKAGFSSLEAYLRHVLQEMARERDDGVNIATLFSQHFGAANGVDLDLQRNEADTRDIDFSSDDYG